MDFQDDIYPGDRPLTLPLGLSPKVNYKIDRNIINGTISNSNHVLQFTKDVYKEKLPEGDLGLPAIFEPPDDVAAFKNCC